MRAGYLGPEGTFTHEALIDATGSEVDLVAYPTIYETVMAVHEGAAERALVPIENSLEGSVNATLDALAIEAEEVVILGEVIHPIRHCLIARSEIELGEIEVVVSHPQANAQCARFIRSRLPSARVLAGDSTADAVRMVAEHEGRWAAIGTRIAAERYGCYILRAGIEDVPENETRFAWLGPAGAPAGLPGRRGHPSRPGDEHAELGPWKTAIVFWGPGAEQPGWLVGCLSEFAARDVNLTRIESRPRKQGLGRYMFFVDLEGRETEPHLAEALKGLEHQVEVLRVLGSFPAAA